MFVLNAVGGTILRAEEKFLREVALQMGLENPFKRKHKALASMFTGECWTRNLIGVIIQRKKNATSGIKNRIICAVETEIHCFVWMFSSNYTCEQCCKIIFEEQYSIEEFKI